MDRIEDFQKWWEENVISHTQFKSHQYFLRHDLEAEPLHRFLKEIHYLLQEELKSLELACVVKRGRVQQSFQSLYEYRWARRHQIRSIELDLESQLKLEHAKPRSETISFASFSCYTVDHLHPIAYFGPHFHFHRFLLELSNRCTKKRARLLDETKEEAVAFSELLRNAWSLFSEEEINLIKETCFTAAKIFEYLLSSIEREAQFGSPVVPRQDPKWPPSVLFHERRSPLIQA